MGVTVHTFPSFAFCHFCLRRKAPTLTLLDLTLRVWGGIFLTEPMLQQGGIHHDEVRGWRGWHHHITLTLLAMLFLLRLTLTWQDKAPRLTIQDVRDII
jgi:hypothetical protein